MQLAAQNQNQEKCKITFICEDLESWILNIKLQIGTFCTIHGSGSGFMTMTMHNAGSRSRTCMEVMRLIDIYCRIDTRVHGTWQYPPLLFCDLYPLSITIHCHYTLYSFVLCCQIINMTQPQPPSSKRAIWKGEEEIGDGHDAARALTI